MSGPQRIVVVGGGYVGMYTALRLQRKLRAGEATITVVDPQPNMTYQPFLPEAAAGSIEPRHVVVPLRKVLRKCTVLTGRVTAVDAERKIVTVLPVEGVPAELAYDHLVVAPGAVARTLPVPGLAECGIGFGSVGEAIHLRNHVLSRLDVASTTEDEVLRRRALTFVVVGAGYAGIEVFGELEDMARAALRHHPGCPKRTCGGCWWKQPIGCCRKSRPAWPSTPCGGCANAAPRCGWAPGCPQWTVGRWCSPTASSSPRTRWSGPRG